MKSSEKRLIAFLGAILMLLMVSPLSLAADETHYLTWDEYKEANGITGWDYNVQAAVIASVADHAVELYAAGQKDEAYDFATEIRGFGAHPPPAPLQPSSPFPKRGRL